MDLSNATPLRERREPLAVFGSPTVWREEVLPPSVHVGFNDEPISEASDRTLWDTTIVHTIAGRARLRVPALRTAPGLAQSFEALLAAQPGIIGASVNSWCHSVTITYDSFYWNSDSLCAFLRQLRRAEIALYELLRSPETEASRSWLFTWIEPSTCWRVLGYFTLVVGIILAILPLVPGGIPFLLLSSVCFSKAAAFRLQQELTVA